ncbi:MAG TPA: hypothetical protein DCQ31_14035 [Bacteroidales bacterium]|nr:hypothetical protein [Bacteroidales bacterium]
MDDLTLKQLWNSADNTPNEIIALSRKNSDDITQLKAQSLLSTMKPIKIVAVLIGIVWVIFIDSLILGLFNIASIFFLASAIIQVVLTKIAIGIYLYHLILINNINFSEPVVAVQERLLALKTSTLWVARILFLQLPVWTTFYWNLNMLNNGNLLLWGIQIFITLLFTYVAVWLFLNIKFENRNKKWFKLIFTGNEWTPLIEAMELYEQTLAFKRNE